MPEQVKRPRPTEAELRHQCLALATLADREDDVVSLAAKVRSTGAFGELTEDQSLRLVMRRLQVMLRAMGCGAGLRDRMPGDVALTWRRRFGE